MAPRLTRDAYVVLQVRPDAHQLVIRAAYRALAALYHPDNDPRPGATERMAEANDAYAKLRTPELRASYDRSLAEARAAAATSRSVIVQPMNRPAGTARESSVIDFGRYHGWRIADLVRHDPEYLMWLSRHSSGIRYRREIAERLEAQRVATAPPPKSKRR